MFCAAHNLLALRGEDHSKRRTNPTDYLLGGLITCRRCGKRDRSAWQAQSLPLLRVPLASEVRSSRM